MNVKQIIYRHNLVMHWHLLSVAFKSLQEQRKAVARGGATAACAPPFKKKKYQLYFLCRIIRFYTNNPKCLYVYLSFYLNDYQIIDKVNTI